MIRALNVTDGTLAKPELSAEASAEKQRKQLKGSLDLLHKANSYAKSMITSTLM